MNTIPSIIFTMGPSTLDETVLTKILSKHVSFVRFNMSHGDHEEHHRRLEMVRRIARDLAKDIRVFADLCGPKIRVTALPRDPYELLPESTVRIVKEKENMGENGFTISYPDLSQHVTHGTDIALDDGKLLLSVTEVAGTDIICRVVRGGTLLDEKGVNIIGADIPIDPFTDKDRSDALFALEQGFDAVALSFVKRKEDITNLRTFLREHSDKTVPIIAKIETKLALQNIGGILDTVDMIMVARGDLGIEIPVEKIPIIQKELVFLAKDRGVPAIVATEMLKSMTANPFPTRAEVTDCINALMDGASYIMLSDETTVGNYPVEAVTLMDNVISEFIDHQEKYLHFEKAL